MSVNLKKIAVILSSVFLLTACGQKSGELENEGDISVTVANPGTQDDFRSNVATVVYFGYDSSVLSVQDMQKLDEQIEWMNRYPDTRFVIEGNCDSRGTVDYNIALGERRASAVYRYLVEKGIDASRLTVKSNGKELAVGISEEEYQKDRNATTLCS